jgi:TPR repeat protein
MSQLSVTDSQSTKDPLDPLWDKGDEAAKKGDIAGALFIWQALAEKGVWQIYARIGEIFEVGANGVEKNISKALHWYRKAVFEGNDPIAHVGLGRAYYLGVGAERNLITAHKHFENAFSQGSLESALYLGIMYRRGDGVSRDYRRAEKYLKIASGGGYFYAYAELAGIAFEEKRNLFGLYLLLKSFILGLRISRKDPLDPRLLGIERSKESTR